MKEPWEVFGDIYWEMRRKKGHDMAIVDAIASFLFEMERRKDAGAQRALASLKLATDAWDRQGGGDRMELREKLKHAWTDAMLG